MFRITHHSQNLFWVAFMPAATVSHFFMGTKFGRKAGSTLHHKSVAVFGSFHFIHSSNYVVTAILKLPSEGS